MCPRGQASLLFSIWWVFFGPGILWLWASGASNLKSENARMVWIGKTLKIIRSQAPVMARDGTHQIKLFPVQTVLEHFPGWIKYAFKEEIIAEMRGNSPFVHRAATGTVEGLEGTQPVWHKQEGHRLQDISSQPC